MLETRPSFSGGTMDCRVLTQIRPPIEKATPYEHDAEARQAVDEDPADEEEEEHGRQAENRDSAHGGCRSGLLKHPPGERDAIQAVAQAGDRLPRPEKRKGAVAETIRITLPERAGKSPARPCRASTRPTACPAAAPNPRRTPRK